MRALIFAFFKAGITAIAKMRQVFGKKKLREFKITPAAQFILKDLGSSICIASAWTPINNTNFHAATLLSYI
jgi:hypothetical protein